MCQARPEQAEGVSECVLTLAQLQTSPLCLKANKLESQFCMEGLVENEPVLIWSVIEEQAFDL